MSEGMHSTTGIAGKRSRKRLVIVVASAAVAVAAIGVSIQFFRAQPGIAGDEGGTASLKAAAGPVAPADAYARVGDKVISRSMVAAECLERHGGEVLDRMINRAIIEQACYERGIEVSAAEVQGEVVEIAKRFNLDKDAWLKMLQAERGITAPQYYRDIIWPMLALKKMAGTEVNITEEDMQKAFLRNYGPRVECKLIMCDNFRRANELWKKAQETPEEFGRLARESSIEPTSRALDGDVPPIRMYGGNDKLEEVAFKLKKGEVSGIVDVSGPNQPRFVILYCKGRTQQVVQDLSVVREDLHKQLKDEKVQEAVAKVFEEIRGQIRVDNYLNNTVAGLSANPGVQRSGYTAGQPGQASEAGQPTAPRSPVPAPRTSAGQKPSLR